MKFIWADGHETERDVHGDAVPDYYGLPLYDVKRRVSRVVTFKREPWTDHDHREWVYREVVPTTNDLMIDYPPPSNDMCKRRNFGPLYRPVGPSPRTNPFDPLYRPAAPPKSYTPEEIEVTLGGIRLTPGSIDPVEIKGRVAPTPCYYCGKKTTAVLNDVANCGRHR